jgi:hypothetical protein
MRAELSCFLKVKEGSSLAGKGANKVVSIANVVPSLNNG